MLLGMNATEVIREIKDRPRGTTAPQLIKFLRARGWSTSPMPRKIEKVFAPSAICRVRWGPSTEKRTHWVLWTEGRYWDPLVEGEPLFTRHDGGRRISVLDCWPPGSLR